MLSKGNFSNHYTAVHYLDLLWKSQLCWKGQSEICISWGKFLSCSCTLCLILHTVRCRIAFCSDYCGTKGDNGCESMLRRSVSHLLFMMLFKLDITSTMIGLCAACSFWFWAPGANTPVTLIGKSGDKMAQFWRQVDRARFLHLMMTLFWRKKLLCLRSSCQLFFGVFLFFSILTMPLSSDRPTGHSQTQQHGITVTSRDRVKIIHMMLFGDLVICNQLTFTLTHIHRHTQTHRWLRWGGGRVKGESTIKLCY